MDRKKHLTEPKPYSGPFDHISDICLTVRFCFEQLNTENANDLVDVLERLRSCEDMTSETVLPTVLIREKFALSDFEYFCVMLGIASALEWNGRSPTFWDAISHYPFTEKEDAYLTMLDGKPLRYLFDIEDSSGIAQRFKLKSFIFDFIIGNRASMPNVFFKICPDELPLLYRDLYKNGVELIPENLLSCFVIKGKTGSGRRTLAAQICSSFDINTAVVYAEDIKDIHGFADGLTGVCILTDSVPVIIADEAITNAVSLANELSDLIPVVFICTNSEEKQIRPRSRSCFSLRLAPLDPAARIKAWDYHLNGADIDTRFLAERYRLSVGDIAEVCKNHPAKPVYIKELINGILSLNSESPICNLIRPVFRLDDLAAQDHITDTLKRIIRTAEKLPRLIEQCGFGKLFPHGMGLDILFYGVSGTGKTMSACIIAAELCLDVMRVDLSRMEGKDTGETERRISEAFRKAEENNCLLFFDKADSLLTEHDGAQTAHLLREMEKYSGIVVLASNIEGNIAPAIRRRMHFTLEFLKPDAAARAELWRRFIPEALPQKDIDFNFLADAFDLSPAEIKWAALSAAVSAEGSLLSMRHIMTVLKYEYEKLGLPFQNADHTNINSGSDPV